MISAEPVMKIPVDQSVPAQAVVDEIRAAGGEAIANSASVTDFRSGTNNVQNTMDTQGRIDILISNAGILRDKSFAKMELEDFRMVLEVHLMGSVNCCKAVGLSWWRRTMVVS